ncbi:MAG: carboxypeptidase-like regulatory domain-containing protein [Bacteroidales bacterium]|nr:carboxypeptidase-like regulatory domain-containing protein [Bacteroidales bacterium]
MKKLFAALTIILIAYNTASSQTEVLEKRISLHCTEMKISEIIQQISKNENIRFSYGQLQDMNIKKSIYFKEGKLKFILSKMFDNTTIRYLAFSDQIILVESEKAPHKKIIKGKIVDIETNEAIPYATIMYGETGQGVISDYNGNFELEFDRNNIDTLRFASLGFKSRKLATKKILNKNVIKISLQKDLIPIPKVSVNGSDYYNLIAGNTGLASLGALYMDTHGQEVALFIKNKKKKEGKFYKIYFKLSSKGNIDAPFRIRIYQPDSHGKPGEDLLKDILVVKPATKKSWFEVNLSSYNVTFPESGLFISMGGIFPNDFNFYFGDQGFDNLSEDGSLENPNDLSYGQRLCYNKKGKNNTWHKSLSHQWFQLNKQRFNVMIKAKIIYKKSNK